MIKREVLVISDDMSVCYPIKEHLESDSIDVYCTNSPAEALDTFMKQEYCLTIMDFQLPGVDGLEMLHIMCEAKRAPIIAITSGLKSDEKVVLFQTGVAACLEKPVDIAVCVAQAVTLIGLFEDLDDNARKTYPLTFGPELIICPLYRQVVVDGMPLELTRREFDLFLCLAQHPGQVWSRNQLYQYVWSDTLGLDGDRTVKTHIGNLKRN